jgi:hypothetical protein
VTVVVVAVGAGDEHGPPGADGIVVSRFRRRRALGRQPDAWLEVGPRPRDGGAEARGEQKREAEASGHGLRRTEEGRREGGEESEQSGGGGLELVEFPPW